jgi:hypothetical protein
MATRTITVVVVTCDICGTPYDMDGIVLHFAASEEGVQYVAEYGRWERIGVRLVCDKSDFVHDRARIPEVAL